MTEEDIKNWQDKWLKNLADNFDKQRQIVVLKLSNVCLVNNGVMIWYHPRKQKVVLI